MRIGIFTDSYLPDVNGVVTSVVTLENALRKLGHDVFIITNHKGISYKLEGNILRLPGVELKFLYGYKMSTPYQFGAKRIVEDMNLDVIHVQQEFGVSAFGRICAKELQIPLIYTYHTMYEDYTHYVNRFDSQEFEKICRKFVSSFSKMLGGSVQGIIAPSNKTKETLQRYGIHTPIYVVPTGLDFDRFQEEAIGVEKIAAVHQELHYNENEVVCMFVGRIAEEKSLDLVIRSLSYVENKNVRLVIVGDGPKRKELEDLVVMLQLEDRIQFLGLKPSDEIPAYYAVADCFISASKSETQGLTYIEALASGLPIFVRPDPVVNDLVIENETGYFFEDEKELGKKLDEFAKVSKEDKSRLHDNAKNIVKPYNGEVFAKKVLSVYYQAIEDYVDTYEVTKLKIYDDYVKIVVENSKEEDPLSILISLDDYFMNKISKGTIITRYMLEEFLEKESVLNGYRSALKRIAIRDYSIKEMEDYLRKNFNMDDSQLQSILIELQDKGYLNDERFVESYVLRSKISTIGRKEIERDLRSKGIRDELIAGIVMNITFEEEKKKAITLANKLENKVKGMSQVAARQAIYTKLMNAGFDNDLCRQISQDYTIEEDESRVLLEKTIEKAMRLYAHRFHGKELYHKVYAYCMRKGFGSSEIKELLEEMEWEDEAIY